ncbi:hypothetical protein [Falsiroseomonas oryzae]|uniref:hypothetical protein n=1 Tax=Falsiroseomonas oryzae TaxID=2766473 RepID=UPI0022EB5A70|nr:hypothetical protein [Roseomonas sp. MO-31]
MPTPDFPPGPDDAAELRDMAQRARRVARLLGRPADRGALLSIAETCEDDARRMDRAPAREDRAPPG